MRMAAGRSGLGAGSDTHGRQQEKRREGGQEEGAEGGEREGEGEGEAGGGRAAERWEKLEDEGKQQASICCFLKHGLSVSLRHRRPTPGHSVHSAGRCGT